MEGDAPPPIETVCAAIHTLYHNPDPREKERANSWLQDLQKSVFAWKVSNNCIDKVIFELHVCYALVAKTISKGNIIGYVNICRLQTKYSIEKEMFLLKAVI